MPRKQTRPDSSPFRHQSCLWKVCCGLHSAFSPSGSQSAQCQWWAPASQSMGSEQGINNPVNCCITRRIENRPSDTKGMIWLATACIDRKFFQCMPGLYQAYFRSIPELLCSARIRQSAGSHSLNQHRCYHSIKNFSSSVKQGSAWWVRHTSAL